MRQKVKAFVALMFFSMILGGNPALATAADFEAHVLSDKLLLITGPSGNTVVGIDDDGLVLVDGVPAEYAQAYLDFVYAETGQDTVKVLFNTHWHHEQLGLNAILGSQGVKIVAHENTKQWLSTTIRKRGDEVLHTPSPAAALPNDTIYAEGSMPFADSTIHYAYLLQAHTDGDIYISFPAENVLVTGGPVRSDEWVVMDIVTGGFLGGMLDAYETLLSVSDDNTVIVPASGPVLNKAELQAQYETYKTVMVALVELLHKSQSPQEVVDAKPTAGLRPDWGEPESYLDQGFRSFFGHLRNGRHLGVMP